MLTRLAQDGTGVLSAQSLAEFALYAVVDLEFSPSWARRMVRRLMDVFPVVPTTGKIVERSLQVMNRYPLGYFDAQVMATARVHGMSEIVTEGLWNKYRTGKVRYEDLARQSPTFGWWPIER